VDDGDRGGDFHFRLADSSREYCQLAEIAQAGLEQSRDWRQTKWLIFFELLIVAAIFVADAQYLVPFSKTPFLLLFGWISLQIRRVSWGSVGLRLYRNWRVTIGVGVLAGVLLEAFHSS
jgi:hypothetical protein